MSELPDLTNIGPEARIRIEAHKAEEMQCSRRRIRCLQTEASIVITSILSY